MGNAAGLVQQTDPQTTVAVIAASQFLAALSQLGDLNHPTLLRLLANTLNAAADANVSAADVATNLTNHLHAKQHQHEERNLDSPASNLTSDDNNNNLSINTTSAGNNILNGTNSTNNNNNNSNNNNTNSNSSTSISNNNDTIQNSLGNNLNNLNNHNQQQLNQIQIHQNQSQNLSLAAAAAAAVAAAAASGVQSTAAGNNPVAIHSIPHPHSHHALSHPGASLLINNPHYQTVRTKYSTRRYSRRRVGPEEAMADPAIRSTVQLTMPVVPKTILIVLKHRLTVQTAITLACAQTGDRLRKGAIQKKLEAMFREPGAVDSFLAEWDHHHSK